MSRNGELFCRKLIISYNPAKMNNGMRQFLALQLPEIKGRYPQLEVDIRPRRWAEMAVTGVYRDGSERCFATSQLSAMAIYNRIFGLLQDAHDLNVTFSSSTMHLQRSSVQGAWNPWLWMGDRPKPRDEQPKWDRALDEKEWDFYVEKYSSRMKADEGAIEKAVEGSDGVQAEYTKEVQDRWMQHVAPRLQTDLNENLKIMKQNFERGVKPEPVRLQEYRLFSVPDHKQLGLDAGYAARRKEVEHVHSWWRKRQEQLKPPK